MEVWKYRQYGGIEYGGMEVQGTVWRYGIEMEMTGVPDISAVSGSGDSIELLCRLILNTIQLNCVILQGQQNLQYRHTSLLPRH